jgi:hypothetical protein
MQHAVSSGVSAFASAIVHSDVQKAFISGAPICFHDFSWCSCTASRSFWSSSAVHPPFEERLAGAPAFRLPLRLRIQSDQCAQPLRAVHLPS